MNDPSAINNQTLNRDATLNTLMYLSDYYEGVADGTTVKSIIKQVNKQLESRIDECKSKGWSQEKIDKEYGEDIRKINIIENAVNTDSELGNLVIANQSSNMKDPSTGKSYEKGGLNACTFQDKLSNPSNVTVVYRGTAAGEWYDNGLGLSGDMVYSEQQIQAVKYYDYIVENNKWDISEPNIHITGHSKGGNKTQFVIMMSEFSNLITSGYSLDGQCMSHEAIEYMKEKYGIEEYNTRREKIYSISADNDYVNILGANDYEGRLIPNDHIFFLESNLLGIGWHFPDCYMNEDGTVTNFTEQGEVSKLLQGISEQLMDIPSPIRRVITNGAMGIAQLTLGKSNPVNEEKLSYAEIMGAIPLLIETLPGGFIDYLDDKFGVDLDWLSNAVTSFNILYYTPINMFAYGVGMSIDLIIAAKEKLLEIGQKCKELTDRFVKFIDNGVKKIQDWYNKNFNGGYIYANISPKIKLDTYKLYQYAQRIQNVNCRINNLDSRLDSLYWKVGLLDLWNLMQADLMTGYSWRLLRCASYLNDTASDFDTVETRLVNSL